MALIIKKNFLYFSSGIVVGYLLGCTTFMILLTIISALSLIHRNKITALYSTIKDISFPKHKAYIAIIESSFSKNGKIEALVSADINKKIHEYCQWANIENVALFIEKAAVIIFEKDKDWKAHQRSITRPTKQKSGEVRIK